MKTYIVEIPENILNDIGTLVNAGIAHGNDSVTFPDKSVVQLAEIAVDVRRFFKKEVFDKMPQPKSNTHKIIKATRPKK